MSDASDTTALSDQLLLLQMSQSSSGAESAAAAAASSSNVSMASTISAVSTTAATTACSMPLVFRAGSPPEGAGAQLQGPPLPGAQTQLQSGAVAAAAGMHQQPQHQQAASSQQHQQQHHLQQQAAQHAHQTSNSYGQLFDSHHLQHHGHQLHHPQQQQPLESAATAYAAAYTMPQAQAGSGGQHYRGGLQHQQQQHPLHHQPHHHYNPHAAGGGGGGCGGGGGGGGKRGSRRGNAAPGYGSQPPNYQQQQRTSGCGHQRQQQQQQQHPGQRGPGSAAALAAQQQFAPHLTPAEVSAGLAAGQLITGQVRISQRNFEEAYVSHPAGDSDIVLTCLVDRNRALNDDEVAVRIKPVAEWRVVGLDSVGAGDTDQTPKKPVGGSNNSGGQQPQTVRSVMDSDRATFAELFGSDAGDAETALKSSADPCRPLPVERVQRVGQVVAIVRQLGNRRFVGYVRPNSSASGSMALFAPLDSRQPRCLIPRAELPPMFATRPADFEKTLFVAELTGEWRPEHRMPQAQLCRQLGDRAAGFNLELETEVVLEHYGIEAGEFGEDVLTEVSVTIGGADVEDVPRRDFREHCVFTVDPETARDLDDALHIRRTDDGDWEVGVHIADVSHYVRPDSRVDAAARQRATTTYLVQRAYPMLPRPLCENLCSLNPREDKLAFSVVWRLDQRDAGIKSVWFGKSVIRSCCQLSYQHAQHFIEGHSDIKEEQQQEPDAADAPEAGGRMADLRRAGARVEPPHTVQSVATCVRQLHALASKLRGSRFDGGALRIDQPKLAFRLDPVTGAPVGFEVYELRDSNRMIEEFMLLANCSVAQKLRDSLPQLAFLRQHEPPSERALVMLRKTAQALGVPLLVESAGELQASLAQAARTLSPDQHLCLLNLCSRQMQLAKYFCAGAVADSEHWRHYALNVSLYTHFTSPIRRYADVLVHRQLYAAICAEQQQTPADTPEESVASLSEQAQLCNKKKKYAKEAGEKSAELHLVAFLLASGQLVEEAVVMGVLDKSADVLLTRCGLVKRLYMDRQAPMLRKPHAFAAGGAPGCGRLTLHFNGCGAAGHVVTLSAMDTVEVTVTCQKDDPLKLLLMLKPPICEQCGV